MIEKPILFSAWKMSRVLAMPGEGITEMSTMRPIKRQPPVDSDRAAIRDGAVSFYRAGVHYLDYDQRAPYQVGDILWPREHWRTERRYADLRPSALPATAHIWYLADNSLGTWPDVKSGPGRLRPGIFLPKRFARPNRYEVLRVEARRPQDLTNEEIIAEGIRYPHAEIGKPLEAPKGWYRNAWYNLWLQIYGGKSWKDNLLCWRYAFREVFHEA